MCAVCKLRQSPSETGRELPPAPSVSHTHTQSHNHTHTLRRKMNMHTHHLELFHISISVICFPGSDGHKHIFLVSLLKGLNLSGHNVPAVCPITLVTNRGNHRLRWQLRSPQTQHLMMQPSAKRQQENLNYNPQDLEPFSLPENTVKL